jgi:hypothetical protein
VLYLVASLALLAPLARAQPAPPADKVDARSLMQSGVRLLEAKDYLGALAVFKDAYSRFASAKILLNIGTTQTLLGRKADAANSYQRYLDAADMDPAKRADVVAQLAELDKANAVLAIAVSPGDAEVGIDETWQPATQMRVWRVAPGSVVVKARKEGYAPGELAVTVAAGAHRPAMLTLAKLPPVEHEVETRVVIAPQGPRSRFGGFVRAHVSVTPKLGSAVLVGATADLVHQLAVEAAVILGPGIVSSDGSATLPPAKFGAYAGASFELGTGTLRPRVSAGFPIFFDDGARVSLRGAVGIEALANTHVSFLIDLGAEGDLNPRMDIRTFALVPSVSLVGRL